MPVPVEVPVAVVVPVPVDVPELLFRRMNSPHARFCTCGSLVVSQWLKKTEKKLNNRKYTSLFILLFDYTQQGYQAENLLFLPSENVFQIK